MAQSLIPGAGYVETSGTGQNLVPGVGYVAQNSGGSVSASAPGASVTGTATITGGAASGAAAGTAPGATLTGSATITAGVATGGGTSGGTLTTRPQKNNTGTVMANETGAEVYIWNSTTGALVLKKTGVTLDASGVATVTDVSIAPGTSYLYEVVLSGGRRRLNPKAAT